MDERNQFDTRDCAERGLRAEEQFAALARARGYHLTPASSAQNIHEHWDWLMVRDEERLRVDVKAQKRLSRQDAGVQDTWVWVELHGVRPYDRGWLYDGQADLLAFEQRASFLLVVRLTLVDLVARLVDLTRRVAVPAQATYAVYQRSGRPDALTLIEVARVREVAWDEWAVGEKPVCGVQVVPSSPTAEQPALPFSLPTSSPPLSLSAPVEDPDHPGKDDEGMGTGERPGLADLPEADQEAILALLRQNRPVAARDYLLRKGLDTRPVMQDAWERLAVEDRQAAQERPVLVLPMDGADTGRRRP
jgi:hypothetical protein